MFGMRSKKGQSTLEYAILIIIIIGALLALQTYVKRGVQGRLKSATDDIGEQYSSAEGANYSKTVHTTSKTTETSIAGRTETKLREAGKTETNQSILTNADGEYWGK